MIKVGFDISQLAHSGGVSVYTDNLTSQLSKIADLEMTYFYSSLRIKYKGNLRNVKSYKLPPTLFELLFNKWRNVSIERFLGPIDIFHSSDWTQPPSKAKKVTTFHDVIPLKHPEWSHPKIVEVFKRRLKLVEKEIDCVIAVSENTKEDLLNCTSIPQEKIRVIHEGVEEIFKPQNEKEIIDFRKKYKLPDSFVLAVGGIGKRKNIERIKQAAKDHNLVILGDDIDVSRAELPLLYCASDCLIYASLYEGFGLPVLEAMACGTPVIASEIKVLKEIGEEALLYTNPEDIEDMRRKVKSILGDKELAETLVGKGLKRAKKFSWKKTAKETEDIYKMLMK